MKLKFNYAAFLIFVVFSSEYIIIMYGGSWAVSNHCSTAVLRCMLLCLIPYMHISNAYHSLGLCTERETAWIQLGCGGWSIPFAACFREAGEDHECQSRRLEMFVRDAACSVADWGDQRGKMAVRIELWLSLLSAIQSSLYVRSFRFFLLVLEVGSNSSSAST